MIFSTLENPLRWEKGKISWAKPADKYFWKQQSATQNSSNFMCLAKMAACLQMWERKKFPTLNSNNLGDFFHQKNEAEGKRSRTDEVTKSLVPCAQKSNNTKTAMLWRPQV